MARAWIEGENIFVTEDDSLIIPFPTVEVPAGTTPQDLKIVDGKLVLKDINEKLNEIKQSKLIEVKNYTYSLLTKTDWVITKLQELQLGDFTEEEIIAEESKYQPILAARKAIRIWNKNIETAIQQAESIEELTSINIKYE